ncbi:bifunctional DNA primase/polymerase [Streptomyces buecherae]|uniref:bifunctional DNA primase/polymerase n=1 Tax=Streptomyces buecherae TaxID=2763006 RepID=UPI0033C1E836
MTARPCAAARVPRWVAAAADDPDAVRALWREDPRRGVRLATGRTFDAVTVELRTGMEALDLLRRRTGAPAGAWQAQLAATAFSGSSALSALSDLSGLASPSDSAGNADAAGSSGPASDAARDGARPRAGAYRRRACRVALRAHAGPSLDAARTCPSPEAASYDRFGLTGQFGPGGFGVRGRFGFRGGRGGGAGRARTVRPLHFPTLVDGAAGRMRLLVPRGAAPWLGALLTAESVEYHGAGARVVLPGPAALTDADTGLTWAVRPGAPVERLRCLLGPLAAALATAQLTVGWCSGVRTPVDPYAETG